jgi:hypothetical protein
MATGSEVIFSTAGRGRIINADEAHHKYSNEGDCGGGSRDKGGTDPLFRTGDLASMSDADKCACCWHSFMLAWLATNLETWSP